MSTHLGTQLFPRLSSEPTISEQTDLAPEIDLSASGFWAFRGKECPTPITRSKGWPAG